MSEPQAPASLTVPALVRQVTAAGGFATVLVKGSPYGSSLTIVHRFQGDVSAWEKVPQLDGAPRWRQAAVGDESVRRFVAAQQRFDPDHWAVELDVADPARFVPGLRHDD